MHKTKWVEFLKKITMTAITTGLHHDKKKLKYLFSSLRTRLIEEALAKEYLNKKLGRQYIYQWSRICCIFNLQFFKQR